MTAQNLRHVQQQIAEIGRIHRREPGLIIGIEFPRPIGGEVAFLVRGDPRRGQAAILPALDDAH